MSLSRKTALVTPSLDVSVSIAAPAARVLRSFFEAEALSAWWEASHSVTTPRVLGPYAVEWPSTEFRDDVLGRLGGVFRGTIVQFDAERGFLVADAMWLPPDGDPIGPMALEVTCVASGPSSTHIRIVQTGFEESDRWRRYYEVISRGWTRALASLKSLLEH